MCGFIPAACIQRKQLTLTQEIQMANFVPSMSSATNQQLALGDIFLHPKNGVLTPALYCKVNQSLFALNFPNHRAKIQQFEHDQNQQNQGLVFIHQPYIDWSESIEGMELGDRDIQSGEIVVLRTGIRIALINAKKLYVIDPVTGMGNTDPLSGYVGIAPKWKLVLPLMLDGVKIGEQILAQSA